MCNVKFYNSFLKYRAGGSRGNQSGVRRCMMPESARHVILLLGGTGGAAPGNRTQFGLFAQ